MVFRDPSELGFKIFEDFINGALSIVEKIEEIRGSRVFILFIGLYRSIDHDFIEILHDLIDRVDGDLDIILFSTGGLAEQAYVAGRYLQENTNGRLVFLIPRLAKSAGTILACSGDEIVLTRIAELGPIDPVVFIHDIKRYVPVMSLIELFKIIPRLELFNTYKELINKLPVIEIGDYQRMFETNIELTAKLLEKRMFRGNPDKAWEIARRLASYKQHSMPITIYDALEIGLKTKPAEPELEKLLIKLHMLWKNTVLKYEEDTLEGVEEPVEIKIGDKGVFLTRIPLEI